MAAFPRALTAFITIQLLLENSGVPREITSADACAIEHDLSLQSFEAIKCFTKAIITTTEVVVCTDPRRVITGFTPKGALNSLAPHYTYRPPLKRPVFMPYYSCYP